MILVEGCDLPFFIPKIDTGPIIRLHYALVGSDGTGSILHGGEIVNQTLAIAPERVSLCGAEGFPQDAQVEYVGVDGNQAVAMVAKCNPRYFSEGRLLRLQLPGYETAYYQLGRKFSGGTSVLCYLTKVLPTPNLLVEGKWRSILAHASALVRRLLRR